ncbi:MAG: CHASE3 domain-containing protein [Gammaproteobacteria bacterium]
MARNILSNPRFHLNRKVNLGFGLTLALLVAIGIISYRNMSALVQTVHWEVHTHEVLNQLDDLLLQIQNAETGQRGYIITGEQRYLEPYDTALVRIHEELAQLRRLRR